MAPTARFKSLFLSAGFGTHTSLKEQVFGMRWVCVFKLEILFGSMDLSSVGDGLTLQSFVVTLGNNCFLGRWWSVMEPTLVNLLADTSTSSGIQLMQLPKLEPDQGMKLSTVTSSDSDALVPLEAHGDMTGICTSMPLVLLLFLHSCHTMFMALHTK